MWPKHIYNTADIYLILSFGNTLLWSYLKIKIKEDPPLWRLFSKGIRNWVCCEVWSSFEAKGYLIASKEGLGCSTPWPIYYLGLVSLATSLCTQMVPSKKNTLCLWPLISWPPLLQPPLSWGPFGVAKVGPCLVVVVVGSWPLPGPHRMTDTCPSVTPQERHSESSSTLLPLPLSAPALSTKLPSYRLCTKLSPESISENKINYENNSMSRVDQNINCAFHFLLFYVPK